MTRPHPRSTLFPYTTLFRSQRHDALHAADGHRRRLSARRTVRTAHRPGDPAAPAADGRGGRPHAAERSEEHTSELQSQFHLVCRLLLEKKKNKTSTHNIEP